MARYAMIFDTRRCVGCHSCTVACREHNHLSLDMIYNPVTTVGPVGVFPHVHMVHIPLLCMHCDNPPCVDCCPTGSSQQRSDGIVWVDDGMCIGCKACVQACPYHARHPSSLTGTVQKCDFCMERVEQGKEPYCVATCHQRARIFGDLEDPASEVYHIYNSVATIQLLPELNTDPHAYYIIAAGGQG